MQLRAEYVEQFKVCPWSVALKDPLIGRWLLAYGMLDRWREWPPGRRDPQFLEAMTVIANELNQDTSKWHK